MGLKRKLTRVTLLGSLAEVFTSQHEIWAKTPAEAIKLVAVRVGEDNWYSYFSQANERGERYRVVYGGKALSEPELFLARDATEIYIVPEAEGNIFGILAGGALVAAGTTGLIGSSVLASIAVNLGASLVLGGIQSLFSGARDDEEQEQNNAQSFGFRRTPDLATQGRPVPLLYGERVIRDMPLISAYFETEVLEKSDRTVSRTTFYLLYLISQGEIEGFVDAPKESVLFNEEKSSVIKESDLVPNPILRTGTQNQSPITDPTGNGRNYQFDRVWVTTPSPSEGRIAKRSDLGGSLAFTVPDDWDQFPQLRLELRFFSRLVRFEAEDFGEDPVEPNTIFFDVTITDRDGTDIIVDNVRVDATSPDGFEFTGKSVGLMFNYYALNNRGPYQVKIVKTSEDAEDAIKDTGNTRRLQDDLRLRSYQISFNPGAELASYPGYAVCAVGVPAEIFNSNLPDVAFYMKGLKTRDFASDVNNNFTGALEDNPSYLAKASRPDNPVRCTLDLLLSEKYGLGNYVGEDEVNLTEFYKAATYSDVSVAAQPRFSFSAYITSREEAQSLLNRFANVYRAQFYYAEGSIVPVQDKDRGSAQISFSESNVVQETDEDGKVTQPPFEYASTQLSVRHTQVVALYSDQNDLYRQNALAVSAEQAQIDRYGFNSKRIQGFGIPAEKQARRAARAVLRKELLQTRTVTFTVGAEGLLLMPGEIIAINDPLRSSILPYEVLTVKELEQGIKFQVTAARYYQSLYNDIDTGGNVDDISSLPPAPSELPIIESSFGTIRISYSETTFLLNRFSELEGTGYALRLINKISKGDLLLIRRVVDDIEVIVKADNNSRLTLDSPIENTSDTSDSNAETLGQFVAAMGYFDADSLGLAASAKVHTWYVQGFFGTNAVQSSKTLQPTIVQSGIITTLNRKPSIYFPNGTYLTASGYSPLATPTTHVFLGSFGNVAQSGFSILYASDSSSPNFQQTYTSSATFTISSGNVLSTSTGIREGIPYLFTSIFGNSGKVFINGKKKASGSTGTNSFDAIRFGASNDGSVTNEIYAQEFLIFNSALENEKREAIESDVRNNN